MVKAWGISGISKSQVSRLCEEIDGRVKAFLDRPIEGDWPYLWLDATYVKVRSNGRIVSVAVIVAVGVNSDGRREVLGLDIGPSEAETFWTAFLRKLARRGLRGVKLVISDAHEGIKAAVARVLTATWQRCRVHFMRNALAHAGKSGRRVVSAFIATAFAQYDAEAAKAQWRRVADQLRPKVPKLASLMDEAEAVVPRGALFVARSKAVLRMAATASPKALQRLNLPPLSSWSGDAQASLWGSCDKLRRRHARASSSGGSGTGGGLGETSRPTHAPPCGRQRARPRSRQRFGSRVEIRSCCAGRDRTPASP